jgi:geranylgeranyl diphosphate synthase type II
MNKVLDKIEYYSQIVNEKMEEYIKNDEIPLKLQEAMAYSVFAGGKRLRPALVLASCELFGGNIEKALPFACAIEFIHTYSLIHDDLPALDNDDYRRGRLTSHKVFGEDLAILAGDALLSYAFEIMADASVDKDTILATRYITYGAGARKMVAGQWVDVSSNGVNIDFEKMEYIHLNKTAAMIIGAIKAGAVCGGADEKNIELMGEYAKEIGYTFQIVDDILDVEGDSEELGKKTGSDLLNDKTTYVTMFGLEGAKLKAQEHTDTAISLLTPFNEKAEFFVELAKYLLTRKK